MEEKEFQKPPPPKRIRKPLTDKEIKERIRKRGSYMVNVDTAKKLRGYGVPVRAIYPVLMDLHFLKRYTYPKNAVYAKGSINLIKEDIENNILQL